jgi:phosphate transport system substrate-binding protein
MLIRTIVAGALAAGVLLSSWSADARTVIQNKGSDTLVNVAQAWAKSYQKVDPNVAIAVTGGGSGTGIAAMSNGTVDIANASRKMKDKEMKLAKKHGQNPVQDIVGYDAADLRIEREMGKGTRFICVFPPAAVIIQERAHAGRLAG